MPTLRFTTNATNIYNFLGLLDPLKGTYTATTDLNGGAGINVAGTPTYGYTLAGLTGDPLALTSGRLSGGTISKLTVQVGGTTGVSYELSKLNMTVSTLQSNIALEAGGNLTALENSLATQSWTITGSSGNDVATPGSIQLTGSNTWNLGLGNDTATGGIGLDKMYGYVGNDSLNGGLGNDTLSGDVGNDILVGGEGNDLIQSGSGADSMFGGNGNDKLYTYSTTDSVNGDYFSGGAGNDLLTGGLGNDVLNGDGGADSVYGGAGADTINGGAQNDLLQGGLGNDSIVGGNGADKIYGDDPSLTSGGNDRIDGGAGDDMIFGGFGVDSLTGGTGTDTFVFSSYFHLGNGATADTITDFSGDEDVINMSALRSNTPAPVHLSFIGTAAFTNTGTGAVHFVSSAGFTGLEIDSNGDGVVDFQIKMQTGATFTSDNIIL